MTPSDEDRATATGNMQRKLKFGFAVFELCERTDRQTNKRSYSSQYFAPLTGRSDKPLDIDCLSLGVVEEVDGRRRQASLDRLTHVGVDVDLVGARLGHVIAVDQSRQLLPVRRVRRLPVLVALLPEYRVLLAAFFA